MRYPIYGYSNGVLLAFLSISVALFLLILSTLALSFYNRKPFWKMLTNCSILASSFFYPLGLLLVYAEVQLVLSYVFLYALSVPLSFLLVSIFRDKKGRLLSIFDFLAGALLLPCFQLQSWCAIPTFVSLLYFLVRFVFMVFEAWGKLQHSFTFYSLKVALDDLPQGLAIARGGGKILYINRRFLSFLKELGIDPHQKENDLFLLLRWKSFRLVDERSLVLSHRGHFYLLREEEKGKFREMSLSDVDTEIALNEELSEANKKLQKQKTYLLAKLDEMKLLAQHEEKESLRVLLHDTFAEEVSLLHQVLINPAVDNLVPLKDLIRRGLENYEATYADLDDLESFYGLLGVTFVNEGDFSHCPDKRSMLRLIREATDNAIRHGNAQAITLHSENDDSTYRLRITNDGIVPASYVPHNGLSQLKNLLEKEGGELEISLAPTFVLLASLPLPKGS
jgi:hypothetical protein